MKKEMELLDAEEYKEFYLVWLEKPEIKERWKALNTVCNNVNRLARKWIKEKDPHVPIDYVSNEEYKKLFNELTFFIWMKARGVSDEAIEKHKHHRYNNMKAQIVINIERITYNAYDPVEAVSGFITRMQFRGRYIEIREDSKNYVEYQGLPPVHSYFSADKETAKSSIHLNFKDDLDLYFPLGWEISKIMIED